MINKVLASKQVGWSPRIVKMPSRFEILRLAAKVRQGDQLAYERVLTLYRHLPSLTREDVADAYRTKAQHEYLAKINVLASIYKYVQTNW